MASEITFGDLLYVKKPLVRAVFFIKRTYSSHIRSLSSRLDFCLGGLRLRFVALTAWHQRQ
jgi:hypothetical protein